MEDILAGAAAEKCLTTWARRSRFAGSKDRAAIRDIVFDCLRRRRSLLLVSGVSGARGLILGHVLEAGLEPGDIFSGQGYGPAPLSEAEEAALQGPKAGGSGAEKLDIPDWLEPLMQAALGAGLERALSALQKRADVDLRVNTNRISRAAAQALLSEQGISTKAHVLSATCLRVTEGARKLSRSPAYLTGLVELQDAASQAVADMLPVGGSVLDYCAGGGGKTLALAARAPGAIRFFAYDLNPNRMTDLPLRAKRAGANVSVLKTDPAEGDETYDLVLIDVPCSGSGSWRRNPDGKWKLTRKSLTSVCETQFEILSKTEPLVADGGHLAYVTCSLLAEENEAQIDRFIKVNPVWTVKNQKRFCPGDGGDGFYVAILGKKTT